MGLWFPESQLPSWNVEKTQRAITRPRDEFWMINDPTLDETMLHGLKAIIIVNKRLHTGMARIGAMKGETPTRVLMGEFLEDPRSRLVVVTAIIRSENFFPRE